MSWLCKEGVPLFDSVFLRGRRLHVMRPVVHNANGALAKPVSSDLYRRAVRELSQYMLGAGRFGRIFSMVVGKLK